MKNSGCFVHQMTKHVARLRLHCDVYCLVWVEEVERSLESCLKSAARTADLVDVDVVVVVVELVDAPADSPPWTSFS